MSIHRTSEVVALIRLRRSLITVAISYGYFLLAFALWRRGAELPPITQAVVIVGAIIAVGGVVLAGREIGLWLMTASLAIATIYLVVDPFVTIAWFQLSVLIAIISLAVVFLFIEHTWTLTISILVSLALFNFFAYFSAPVSLLRSGSFLGRGAVSTLMVLSTNIYALYGWNRMLMRARSNDIKMTNLLTEIKTLEKSQESQKIWRNLVIRVHETTLNTIRSLLTLKDTPIQNLRSAIENSFQQDRSIMRKAQERRSGSVIAAIRAGIDSAALQERVRIISQGVNLHLEAQVAETIERVVREALRNAVEHAAARNIEIQWRTSIDRTQSAGERERGRVQIMITDDGSLPIASKSGGIGTSLVMAKSIRELGGTFTISTRDELTGTGAVVKLDVPTFVTDVDGGAVDFPSYSAIDLGRYMALLTLFGPAMTGVFFFPILGIWWSGQWISQAIGFIALLYLLITTFIRMKRLGWIESTVTAIGLLSIIHFLQLDPLTCTQSQPFQWVINSSVYGLFIILLWGKWQITVVAYPIFLYLVAPFHDLIPQECNFIFNFPILNTLFSFLFVAVVFILVYKSFERVETFRDSRKVKNLELVSEIERSDAAFEKILELDATAQQIIRELLEHTGPLSSDSQNSLRRIDARLRAEIQIDPVSSSGLTILARAFVNRVTEQNRWMEVRSIHGDEDAREIPPVIRERFFAVTGDVPNGSSIQVIVDDGYAELSLRCGSAIPDSVRDLQKTVQVIQDPEIAVFVHPQSPQEYILVLRREKLSR